MSIKRKISARKIVQAVLTLSLGVACVMAVTSATNMQKGRELNNVSIHINNEQYGFVTKQEIKDMLLNKYESENNKVKASKLDVKTMERIVAGNPWIEEAQVYIDNDKNLHTMVTQRVPVVRIFDKDGASYYLDKHSKAMPLSGKYNHYSMVVTNSPSLLKDDSLAVMMKSQILDVVKYIQRDSFWRAQVSQVVVRDDLGFEIVPVMGEQQIIIGDANNLDVKFGNLLTFYIKVLNEVGWDKYDVLDLSYKGQLVASPGLDWNLPEDKVIRRINWVNSILGEEKKRMVFTNTLVKKEPVEKKQEESNQVALKTVEEPKVESEKAEKKQDEKIADNRTTIAKPETPKETQAKQANTFKEEKKEPVAITKENNNKPKYIYAGNGN